MDRNSAIGLTLIAALLLVYFYWFSPKPQPESAKPVVTESPSALTPQEAPREDESPSDSLLTSAFGELSSFAKGTEKITPLETEDLRISFSSKGGIIKELELKNYRTYSQKPLKLITPGRAEFNLLTNYQGKEVDLYKLYYNSSQTQNGDTIVVTFNLQLADGSSLKQIYSIPPKGYQIKYRIEQKGLGEQLAGEHLTFQWNDKILPLEKDLQETRNNTTITYYS